jgi:predicted ATPase
MASLGALVVLDNCERVIGECAALATALLSSACGSVVLATSLEPLGIEGETTLLVRPLPIAPEDAPATDQLASDAARLFLDRAVSSDPRGNHAATPALVSGICRALEGIPLAIELVVARVRALPLQEIAASLEDLFSAAADGPAGFEPRHRSLESLLTWSWDTLAPEEASDLEALSVCQGGFDAEAAASILGRPSIRPISRLVDKSLLTPNSPEGGPERWRLLDPVRLFARRRLSLAGREAACREAHASHFTGRAARLGRDMTIIRDAGALDEAEREWSNLAAAFSWLAATGRPGQALQAMIDLRRFFLIRDRIAELMAILAQIDASGLPAPDKAAWYELSAICAWFSLDMQALEAYSREASECWTAAGNELAARRSELIWLGFYQSVSCGIDGLRTRLGESAVVFHRLGERWLECAAWISLANQELKLQGGGTWPRFREAYGRASALAELTGDLEALVTCAWYEGESSRFFSDAAAVERALERCRRFVAAIGSTRYLSETLSTAAYWELQNGNFHKAEAYADEAAGMLERLGHSKSALDLRIVQAEALNLAGRTDEADAAMARARALAGDDDDTVALVDYHAAFLLASRGETGAAVQAMKKAVDMAEPGSHASIRLRHWSAKMLLALEEYDAAGKLFSEVGPAFSETRDPDFHAAVVRFTAFLDAGTDPEGVARRLQRWMAGSNDDSSPIRAGWWAATASRAFARTGAKEQAFWSAFIAARGAARLRGSFYWVERTLFPSLLRQAAAVLSPEARLRLEAEAEALDPDGEMEPYVRSIAEHLDQKIREAFGG